MKNINYSFDTIKPSQLHRIIYSGWDFQQALSALTFLMEEMDYDEKYTKIEFRRFKCFEVNAIISFCRPFEKSRGRTILSLKAIGAKLTEEEHAFKNYLMDIRRKLVAHSDEEEMNFLCKTHDLKVRGSEFVLPELVFDENLLLEEDEVYKFEELLHKVTSYIATFSFHLAQENPNALNFYKKSKTIFNN